MYALGVSHHQRYRGMDEISWQRCGRSAIVTCRCEHLNKRVVERDIFPYTDLEQWTEQTAIWHFAEEDCGASRRLDKILEIDVEDLRGRTIRLHPVFWRDLKHMYADLTRRNVKSLVDSVPSAFFPAPPVNSLRYPAGEREVPLVGRDQEEESCDEGEYYDEIGDGVGIMLVAIDQADDETDYPYDVGADDALPAEFLHRSASALRATNTHGNHDCEQAAEDRSTTDTTEPSKLCKTPSKDHTPRARFEYVYDWQPSFKVDASKWQPSKRSFKGTTLLGDVYVDIARTVQRRLDGDKHADSKGPLGLVDYRQALLITAQHIVPHDFVKDWAMRLDDSGRSRVAEIQDLYDHPPTKSNPIRFNVQEKDTIHQHLLEIEPEVDERGEELSATAIARFRLSGPFRFYRVARQLFEGESTSTCRPEAHDRVDSRVFLCMRARHKDDHRGPGAALVQIRTWLIRDLLISDVDTAELAKEHYVDGTVFATEYRDIWDRCPRALRSRFLEREEECRAHELQFTRLRYCFRSFDPADHGIGVRRLREKRILVAARYVNHLKHIDHLIEQGQYRHLNQLKLAAQNIDYSLGRSDVFGDFDDYSKICAHIMQDMSEQKRPEHPSNLAKLFREPLADQWRLELWVLPQIECATKLYRFTEDDSLGNFLDASLVEQGDLRLFMEVHIVPKICGEKTSRRGEVTEKRERAKRRMSEESRGGGRRRRRV